MYCSNCFNRKQEAEQQHCAVCQQPYRPNGHQYLQPTGKLLNGQYLIGKVLGHGGFGATYLGFDTSLHTRVAIKEYFPTTWSSRDSKTHTITPYEGENAELFESGKRRFIREAQLLSGFRNSHIIRVYNSFEDMGTAYFVMEYLDGETLSTYLKSQGGQLSFEAAMQIIEPLFGALTEIHEKDYLHLDISPDNIYLTQQGLPILLDFGSARKQSSEKSLSIEGMFKRGYSPIELYTFNGRRSPASDIYALAATIYRMLTGHKPPDASERNLQTSVLIPPSQLGVRLTPHQERWLLAGLEISPENRPVSIRAWQQLLGTATGPHTSGFSSAEDLFLRMVIMPKLDDRRLTDQEEEEILRVGQQENLSHERIQALIKEALQKTGSRRVKKATFKPDKPKPKPREKQNAQMNNFFNKQNAPILAIFAMGVVLLSIGVYAMVKGDQNPGSATPIAQSSSVAESSPSEAPVKTPTATPTKEASPQPTALPSKITKASASPSPQATATAPPKPKPAVTRRAVATTPVYRQRPAATRSYSRGTVRPQQVPRKRAYTSRPQTPQRSSSKIQSMRPDF